MELKLNIYNGNEIEKTYITQDFRLSTGVCEDIINVIDIEQFANLNNLSDEDALKLLPTMMKLAKQFNPIMKQVFPELTDDEYKRTDMSEVSAVAWQVIMYTITQLFNVSSKN